MILRVTPPTHPDDSFRCGQPMQPPPATMTHLLALRTTVPLGIRGTLPFQNDCRFKFQLPERATHRRLFAQISLFLVRAGVRSSSSAPVGSTYGIDGIVALSMMWSPSRTTLQSPCWQRLRCFFVPSDLRE